MWISGTRDAVVERLYRNTTAAPIVEKTEVHPGCAPEEGGSRSVERLAYGGHAARSHSLCLNSRTSKVKKGGCTTDVGLAVRAGAAARHGHSPP